MIWYNVFYLVLIGILNGAAIAALGLPVWVSLITAGIMGVAAPFRILKNKT
jgi:hypothetical protein